MAREVLVKMGTPICFADSVQYSSSGSGIPYSDHLRIRNLQVGNAVAGDKGSLGAVHADRYAVLVGIEFVAAPTAGRTIDFYWSCSYSATAGTGNAGGTSGASGPWPADSNEDEWSKQLVFIGSLVATNDISPAVQRAAFIFRPPTQYGIVVVDNNTDAQLHSDGVEMYVAFVPIVAEAQ